MACVLLCHDLNGQPLRFEARTVEPVGVGPIRDNTLWSVEFPHDDLRSDGGKH